MSVPRRRTWRLDRLTPTSNPPLHPVRTPARAVTAWPITMYSGWDRDLRRPRIELRASGDRQNDQKQDTLSKGFHNLLRLEATLVNPIVIAQGFA
jgi:hypothetical protein